MSEKNVQGAQWTKSTTHKLNYDAAFGAVAGLTGGLPASIYGGVASAGIADIPPQPPDGMQQQHSYANVRFQPPSILHHVTAPPPPPPSTPSTPTPTPTSVLLPLGATSSNVPAPSGGFVPPPFIAAGVGVANVQPSNATSVLTPNPFAVHSAAGSNANFGLEQFQHLNPQQQYEFTKMMTAMNSAAAAASLATSTVVTTTTSLNNLGTTTAMMTSQQQTAGVRHHVVEVSSSSGAITSSIAENVMNVINVSTMAHSSSSSSSHGRSGFGVKVPDEEKMRRIQHVVETGIGDQAKQQIMHILDCIATLKPVEKLLLYLRMPGEAPETDPLRHPQNPLGTRSEINHTINWVRSHLEHDPQVSIPKQDVYNDYIAYCERLSIKPLSTADFGKVMKQVFPEIRPRRLGTRGHSRYCYAAMRKTTKLTPPQLPQLSNNISSKLSACEGGSSNTITFGTADDCSESSWNVIKLWAESMLNIKVEDMKGLANHIQNNNLIAMGASLINQKKAAQREPKDKRALGDMGPLKKRRKKKRKGSSSSESSCNQSIQQRSDSTTNKSSNPSEPSMSLASDDEKKPLQLLEVKQEIMDSPSYQRVKSLTSPKLQAAAVSNFRDSTKPPPYEYKKPHCANPLVQQQQQQQQILPMNLATEPRTVLTRAPASSGLVNVAASTAVKNLTPKIMDLSSAAAAGASSFNVGPEQVPIKEEVVDDYNTTTVFCKKVLKAQQTKGFWANSPTSGGINNSGGVPATTITAASPPLSVIATTSAASVASAAELDAAQATNYLMGPPAQITTSTSPSASSTAALPMEANAATQQPKVSSRNMLQLRAKKLRYYQIREAMANTASAAGDSHHAADGSTTDIDKDADLPENLGLPRERVISICNMDKHELDDYFLPGEEENSQDQEAELLQYFQTGDAEEKQNSLDANKTSNPTASNLPPTLTHESNNNNNNNNKNNVVMNNNKSRHAPNSYRPVGVQMSNTNKVLQSTELGQANIAYEGGVVSAAAVAGRNTPVNSSAYAVGQRQAAAAAVSATSQTPAVGSASASLALMSQKHQQQQNQQQQQQQQQLPNKRKISLNTMAISKINKTTARKNCIFFPISPNINSVGTSSGGTASHSASNGSVSLFASPGVTRQFRPRPAGISKQHSLDFETSSNSDPMIGACRRRKSIYSSGGGGGGGSQSIGYGSTTSASAPPSPSLAQQQQKQQQQLLHSHLFNLQQPVSSGNQWQLNSAVAAVAYNDLSSQAASLLADQNSLDLDLFDAAGGGARGANAFDHDSLLDAAAEVAVADCVLSSLTETQRSQSVPLSQLQRNLSPAFNRSFQTNFSTCTSVAQTPVPDEFADFNLFSENSQHGAQSMAQVNKQQSREIKLEDAADVLTSDTTGMLDEVDVSEILSSPDFVAKFSSEVHLTSNVAATATCSSAGSSSGYSSGACTTFGSGGGGGGGGGSGGGSAGGGGGGALAYSFGSGIVSRSVPSTPLPHQQQYLFGASNFYDRQRTIDEIHLSPTAVSTAAGGNASSSIFSSAASSINAAKYSNSHSQQFSRNAYDISKSMPTTPITTPCFRYSPAEFHRDFLINGNTIDSISSLPSMNVLGGGTDSFMKDDDGMTALNSDSLMDESGTVTPETFTVAADDVGGTAMVGSDILDSL